MPRTFKADRQFRIALGVSRCRKPRTDGELVIVSRTDLSGLTQEPSNCDLLFPFLPTSKVVATFQPQCLLNSTRACASGRRTHDQLLARSPMVSILGW